jgi:hypothetical protein
LPGHLSHRRECDDAHSHAYTYTNADAHAHTHAHAHTDAHTHAYTDTDTHTHTHTHAYTDADAHAHTDTDADTDADAHAHTDTDTYTYTDCRSHRHTFAHTDGRAGRGPGPDLPAGHRRLAGGGHRQQPLPAARPRWTGPPERRRYVGGRGSEAKALAARQIADAEAAALESAAAVL